MIDAVIFDMDGTLLDSSNTVPAAYADAIEELCGRRHTHAEIIAAYSAGPAAALIAQFTGREGTDADVDCWLRHMKLHLHKTTVYAGVHEMLEDLRAASVRLAVFTGATRRAAEMQLEHSGLGSSFDVLVGSDEIDAVKPAPDGLFRVCSILGVAPTSAAYVGDALNDLLCADAAGAIPVAAGWGHLYEPFDHPHLLARSPAEVADLQR
jgi:HAD superfamily hydrolase (TIGR01549 family)